MGWEWGGMWGGNMGNSWKPWTQVGQVAQRYWWSEFRTKWRCLGADSTTFKSQECQVRQWRFLAIHTTRVFLIKPSPDRLEYLGTQTATDAHMYHLNTYGHHFVWSSSQHDETFNAVLQPVHCRAGASAEAETTECAVFKLQR